MQNASILSTDVANNMLKKGSLGHGKIKEKTMMKYMNGLLVHTKNACNWEMAQWLQNMEDCFAANM